MRVHLRQSDQGAETVEVAILSGLALILLLTVVQVGLWWHTRSACLHAAAQGLAIARTLNASLSDGEQAAVNFLDRTASANAAPHADAERAGHLVTVRVSANAPRVLPIPGLQLRITHTAAGERERFTTPKDNR